MTKRPSDLAGTADPHASTSPSSVDSLRWVTLLPGVFLVSASVGLFAGAIAASILGRPMPIVTEWLVPVASGWSGVLLAYHWAPTCKWTAARATGLLLAAWQVVCLLLWVTGAGWAGLRLLWLPPVAIGLAVAGAPWLLPWALARRQRRRDAAGADEQRTAPAPTRVSRAVIAPTSVPEALRWMVLLPASGIACYCALCLTFLSTGTGAVQEDRAWLSVAFSHVIAGWVALFCCAWIAPSRKRSVAFAAYLVFLVLALPLSGRMLVARGLDTAIGILALWLAVAAGVGPAVWVAERLLGGRPSARLSEPVEPA